MELLSRYAKFIDGMRIKIETECSNAEEKAIPMGGYACRWWTPVPGCLDHPSRVRYQMVPDTGRFCTGMVSRYFVEQERKATVRMNTNAFSLLGRQIHKEMVFAVHGEVFPLFSKWFDFSSSGWNFK